MSNLFTRLNTTYSGYDLPTVDRNDIVYLSELEENAYEHWIFDSGNSTGLTGRVNNIVLTAQTDAPTYESNALLLNSAGGKGLLTGLADAGTGVITMWAVTRSNGATNTSPQPIFGNYATAGNGFLLGSVVSGANMGKRLYVRTFTNMAPYTIGDTNVDTWTFTAVSLDLTNKTANIYITDALKNEVTMVGSYSVGAEFVMGNGYYTNASGAVTHKYGEFGIIKEAYSIAQLAALYNRSKTRMSARGISVT